MNRTIKFRVWCPTIGFFTQQPHITCDGLQLVWHHTGNITTFTDIRFDTYTIQQYTGLKDMTDKEIYEGDIIQYSDLPPDVVIWNGAGFVAQNIYSKLIGGFSGTKTKIIGNIFETPELLK
jgi:uncharacterized phage protein (TIGR01671 family)